MATLLYYDELLFFYMCFSFQPMKRRRRRRKPRMRKRGLSLITVG